MQSHLAKKQVPPNLFQVNTIWSLKLHLSDCALLNKKWRMEIVWFDDCRPFTCFYISSLPHILQRKRSLVVFDPTYSISTLLVEPWPQNVTEEMVLPLLLCKLFDERHTVISCCSWQNKTGTKTPQSGFENLNGQTEQTWNFQNLLVLHWYMHLE